MKMQLTEIPIRDLFNGYKNLKEDGVFGYGGKLNIRPQYQREFVYGEKQRDAVMDTVNKNFPLNVMYWVKNPDNTFELMDGQQRTISICEYINGGFALHFRHFFNLTQEEKDKILDYKIMVYICEGEEKEKLDWFKTINIAGEKLTDQELRNAIYTGTWLSDSKKYFSKPECPAYDIAKDYVKGIPIRQDYLEEAIDWISSGQIEEYMSKNQHKPNAHELWLYFQSVISWVKTTFINYRPEMKGIPFGVLYNSFKDMSYDSNKLEEEISILMEDEDVTKKAGIYMYILLRQPKYLSIRSFSNNQKREAYEKQSGICPSCGGHFEIEDMEADHIKPWCEGGKTVSENCQMLCKQCNRTKASK